MKKINKWHNILELDEKKEKLFSPSCTIGTRGKGREFK